jgi:hypothetical protein
VGVAYISAAGLLGVWWPGGRVGDGHWSLLLEWVWHISQLLACWECGGLMAGLGAGIGVCYYSGCGIYLSCWPAGGVVAWWQGWGRALESATTLLVGG